jgi:hypothetical protein
MRKEEHIAIPVSAVNEERTLLQILAELRKQTDEMNEQTKVFQQVAADVRSIWNQIDDTPVGFKINETKL